MSITNTATSRSGRNRDSHEGAAWVEVFYDGDCPLCLKEIQLLRWCDRKSRIQFTDIAAKSFDPAEYDKSMKEFMDEIQGRRADGSWITGVEVFRQLYGAIGLWPVMGVTRIPGISHVLELGYRFFARNRLKFTGRCTPDSCKVG